MPTPSPFADIALNVARLIEQAAISLVATQTPLDAAENLPALAQAITRLARCSRQDQAFLRKCAEQDRNPTLTPEPAAERAAHRRHIIRAIEDSIAEAPLHLAEYLLADFHERLDDPLLEADLLTRPVSSIVSELRADLGLCHPQRTPPRRDAIDIAILAARAAKAPKHYPAAKAPKIYPAPAPDTGPAANPLPPRPT